MPTVNTLINIYDLHTLSNLGDHKDAMAAAISRTVAQGLVHLQRSAAGISNEGFPMPDLTPYAAEEEIAVPYAVEVDDQSVNVLRALSAGQPLDGVLQGIIRREAAKVHQIQHNLLDELLASA